MKKELLFKIFEISAAGILFAVIYCQTFLWMFERWTGANSFYTHGFLIPIVSGYLIWKKRKILTDASASGQTSWTGIALISAGVFLHLISLASQVSFLSGLSIIPVLLGLTEFLFSKSAMKSAAFPILFLIFMIPMPMLFIAQLSFYLKLLAGKGAVFMLHSSNVPAVSKGSYIFTPHAAMLVGEVCGGLRSLISLIALGALIAYWAQISKIGKTLLFLAALPIAVLVNSVRIYFLSMISEVYGEKTAQGFLHELSGIMLFLLAFLLLEAVVKYLREFESAPAHP